MAGVTIKKLDHINIRTACLEASITFYRTYIGLTINPPPMVSDLSKGAYCYDECGLAIIHLVSTEQLSNAEQPERGKAQRGMIDHFALQCSGDPEQLTQRLDLYEVSYEVLLVPEISAHLVFIRDPNGVLVEMSFPLLINL